MTSSKGQFHQQAATSTVGDQVSRLWVQDLGLHVSLAVATVKANDFLANGPQTGNPTVCLATVLTLKHWLLSPGYLAMSI